MTIEQWPPYDPAWATSPATTACGERYSYRVYDEVEWDTCGEPAVGCSLDDGDRPGRCVDHLPEFIYLEQWGFVPKPKFVFWILDGPKGFVNEVTTNG